MFCEGSQMRWNLDAVYRGFKTKDFIEDFKSLEEGISDYRQWIGSLDKKRCCAKILKTYIQKRETVGELLERLKDFADLVFSAETENSDASHYLSVFESKFQQIEIIDSQFVLWLAGQKIDDKLFEVPAIREYAFHFNELIGKGRFMLDENVETAVATMQETSSVAWRDLYKKLTGLLTADYCDKSGKCEEKSINYVRNLAFSNDVETRKRAFEAELSAYKKVEKSVAACINGLKGETINICKMRGWKTPLDSVLAFNRMERETLDAMIEAIKQYLPVFAKYYRRKAELLGDKNGLPYYNMFAPIGVKSKSSFTFEEAQHYIIEKFMKFSSELGDFAKKVFAEKWMDAEIRYGKVGGGFCENIYSVSQSRILVNFSGTFNDVMTMAHEIGHAFHGKNLYGMGYLNFRYPAPLAETASIFCETIVKNSALEDADSESAFTILESIISAAGQTIVDIYSRYLFESALFAKRAEGQLSVDDLNNEMVNAQKTAYCGALDEKYLHPYLWLIKPHYYEPKWTFYNFPYAFGMLFAKGLYAKYLEMGEQFTEKYDFLLSETGRRSVRDVAKIMDIELNDIKFWLNSLELLKLDIDKFMDASDKLLNKNKIK